MFFISKLLVEKSIFFISIFSLMWILQTTSFLMLFYCEITAKEFELNYNKISCLKLTNKRLYFHVMNNIRERVPRTLQITGNVRFFRLSWELCEFEKMYEKVNVWRIGQAPTCNHFSALENIHINKKSTFGVFMTKRRQSVFLQKRSKFRSKFVAITFR